MAKSEKLLPLHHAPQIPIFRLRRGALNRRRGEKGSLWVTLLRSGIKVHLKQARVSLKTNRSANNELLSHRREDDATIY